MASKRVARRYREFHGKDVASRRRVSVPLLREGQELMVLGDLQEIVYKRPGEQVPYKHRFSRPYAKLATDSKGRRLYIVGGGYRVTSRGIVK